MTKYSGSGWHNQRVRHSNARKYGRAGGTYLGLKKGTKINYEYPLNKRVMVKEKIIVGKGIVDTKYKIIPEKKHYGYAERGFKTFPLKDGYEIIAHWEKTRNGFRHIVVLMKDGDEIDRAKATYLNRTWESFEYETAIRNLLNKNNIFNPTEKKELLDKMSGKAHEEVEQKFATIGAIAKMGEILTKDKKEANDWKKRMIKAGLGEAIQMPEDWETLSEDEKESRLNKVIEFMKKEKKE